MLDHMFGRPSNGWKRTQVFLLTMASVWFMKKYGRDPPIALLRKLNERFTNTHPWKIMLGTLTATYVAKNLFLLMFLNAPEPMARMYTRSFFRATWILVALDAAAWTTMSIRPKPLRDLLTFFLTFFYLLNPEKADDKVRKFRSRCTVEMMRISWEKSMNPIFRFLTKPFRPTVAIRKRILIPRPLPPSRSAFTSPPNVANSSSSTSPVDKNAQTAASSSASSPNSYFPHFHNDTTTHPLPTQTHASSSSTSLPPITAWLFFEGTEEQLQKTTQLILLFPGGGFVTQDPICHEDYTAQWAHMTAGKIPIVSIDYGKAPEYPYPWALEECFDAYRSIVESNGRVVGLEGWWVDGVEVGEGRVRKDPIKVVLAGDSAGGNLATGVTFKILESQIPNNPSSPTTHSVPSPSGLVLLYPCLNFDMACWMAPSQLSLMKSSESSKSLSTFLNARENVSQKFPLAVPPAPRKIFIDEYEDEEVRRVGEDDEEDEDDDGVISENGEAGKGEVKFRIIDKPTGLRSKRREMTLKSSMAVRNGITSDVETIDNTDYNTDLESQTRLTLNTETREVENDGGVTKVSIRQRIHHRAPKVTLTEPVREVNTQQDEDDSNKDEQDSVWTYLWNKLRFFVDRRKEQWEKERGRTIHTNLSMTSRMSYFTDRIISPELLRAMALCYLGSSPHPPNFQDDYYLSPVVAPDDLLVRFPKTYLLCGEKDPFVDDTVIFAGRLRHCKMKARKEWQWVIERYKRSVISEALKEQQAYDAIYGPNPPPNAPPRPPPPPTHITPPPELTHHLFSKKPHDMVHVKILEGMGHAILLMLSFLPEAKPVCKLTSSWLKRCLEEDGDIHYWNHSFGNANRNAHQSSNTAPESTSMSSQSRSQAHSMAVSSLDEYVLNGSEKSGSKSFPSSIPVSPIQMKKETKPKRYDTPEPKDQERSVSASPANKTNNDDDDSSSVEIELDEHEIEIGGTESSSTSFADASSHKDFSSALSINESIERTQSRATNYSSSTDSIEVEVADIDIDRASSRQRNGSVVNVGSNTPLTSVSLTPTASFSLTSSPVYSPKKRVMQLSSEQDDDEDEEDEDDDGGPESEDDDEGNLETTDNGNGNGLPPRSSKSILTQSGTQSSPRNGVHRVKLTASPMQQESGESTPTSPTRRQAHLQNQKHSFATLPSFSSSRPSTRIENLTEMMVQEMKERREICTTNPAAPVCIASGNNNTGPHRVPSMVMGPGGTPLSPQLLSPYPNHHGGYYHIGSNTDLASLQQHYLTHGSPSHHPTTNLSAGYFGSMVSLNNGMMGLPGSLELEDVEEQSLLQRRRDSLVAKLMNAKEY